MSNYESDERVITPREVLLAIRRLDPDGGEVEPNDWMRQRFHEAVIESYGEWAWDDYHKNWDE
jgi:hypothetical protein